MTNLSALYKVYTAIGLMKGTSQAEAEWVGIDGLKQFVATFDQKKSE